MTSLSIEPLPIINVEDHRINLNNKRDYAVLRGPIQITPIAKNASGNNSISQITFNTPPPNPHIGIDRKVYIKVQFTTTFTGTNSGQPLLSGWGQTIAPRDHPFTRACRTLTVKINNSSISVPLNQFFHALRWYNYKTNKDVDSLSCTPNYPDMCQAYSELFGSVRNPLGNYADGEYGSERRGAFNNISITQTTTTATVIMTLVEPLYISPLVYGAGDQSCLYHVQTFDVTATMESNISNYLFSVGSSSTAPAPTFTNITTILSGTPALLFTYLTPPELMHIPSFIPYPYADILVFPQDTQLSLAPGQTKPFPVNSIQIQTIPRRVYIYARKTDNSFTINDTDTFARIENISVQLGNQSQLLSTATPEQLFQISHKNGCDMSFNQWYGTTLATTTSTSTTISYSGVGSVLALDFGLDIGLNSDLESVGILKNDQLQFNITITNLHPTQSIQYVIYIVLINEGVFTLSSDLRAQQTVGVLTRENVLESRNNQSINLDTLQAIEGSGGLYGGSFRSVLSKIGNTFSKALPFLKEHKIISKVANALGPVVPGASVVGSVAEKLGYGDEEEESMHGGRMMSRRHLRRNMY